MIKPENQTNELLRYQLELKETENAKLREEIEELRQMLVDRKIYSMAPEILSPPSEAGQ